MWSIKRPCHQIQSSIRSQADWRFSYLLVECLVDHNESPNCLQIFRISWLRQRTHVWCDLSVEAAHSSIALDHTSNIFWDPCLLWSCFVFFYRLLILSTVRFQHTFKDFNLQRAVLNFFNFVDSMCFRLCPLQKSMQCFKSWKHFWGMLPTSGSKCLPNLNWNEQYKYLIKYGGIF